MCQKQTNQVSAKKDEKLRLDSCTCRGWLESKYNFQHRDNEKKNTENERFEK